MAIIEPGVNFLFSVAIDGLVINSFTKIAGLESSYSVEEVKEGGENGYVHKLLGRANHKTVTVTRPIDSSSSELAVWFSGFQVGLSKGIQFMPLTAVIAAYNRDGESVAEWTLGGVIPIRYTGPTFEAGGNQVLTETLEFAHSGFVGG